MAEQVIHTVSKQDFDSAQKEIADLRQRLDAAKEDKVKEQVTALNATLASKDDEIKNIKLELENVKASKVELQKEVEASKAKITSVEAELKTANEKIDTHAKSIVRANRISTLVDKGVDKTEAETIVDAAVDTSDAVFQVIVDTQAKLVEANKANAAFVADKDKNKDKDKKKEKDAAKADEQKLEGAEAEEEVPLSTDASADESDSVVAGLADFLAQEVEAKRKK